MMLASVCETVCAYWMADFLAALEASGSVPLPPYIRGGVADARDRADYQTMFARLDGSVAAPTAALHFTPALMQALGEAGIGIATVTLHVGAGTFQPVRVDDTDAHTMHAEWGEVSPEAAAAIAETACHSTARDRLYLAGAAAVASLANSSPAPVEIAVTSSQR